MPPFYKGPRTKQDDIVKTVGRKGSMQMGAAGAKQTDKNQCSFFP